MLSLTIFLITTTAGFALAFADRYATARAWKARYESKRDEFRELERKQIIAKFDEESLAWYKEENERLRIKCHAICHQIRRMKGRGNVTCEMHPTHNF